MDFKNYVIIPNYNTGQRNLFVTTEAEIEQCENALSIRLDQDYKEYVLKYGNGIMGGTYVRIYLPARITNTLHVWRKRITDYWFWDDGKEVITKNDVLQSVRIGDTFDGDEIILFANDYYVLPRHSGLIYKTGSTLSETIEWLCSKGILTEPFAEREFEPFDPAEWGAE